MINRFENFSDSELLDCFKAKNANEIDESLDIVCEAVLRLFKLDVYKEQKKAVKQMINNGFIDVKTGQGKSLIAAIASILLSKNNTSIFVISVNDYLAERDFIVYKKIFDFFGISSAYNKTFSQINDLNEKFEIYKSSIVYTSSHNLIFDYLRQEIGESEYNIILDVALVDEADFVLIDNASSEFTLSDGSLDLDNDIEKFKMAKKMFKFLNGAILNYKIDGIVNYDAIQSDYVLNKEDKRCYLTTQGIDKLEKIFKIDDITSDMKLYNAILNTLEAYTLFSKDKDYKVIDNKIILIDQNNGRLLHSSRREKGMQLALELKEDLDITYSASSMESLSYQVFYNLFDNLFGMSGTLCEASTEIETIYGRNIVKIKPHQKSKRIDLTDIVCKTSEEKSNKIINLIESMESNNIPILIICESDYESDFYFNKIRKLSKKSIQLLNSSNYEKSETEILNKAGLENYITISTFLCSRGTDIKVSDDIDSRGGLYVISSKHYENIRIDNQIRGRTGRIGQKGVSVFFSSLDDDIFSFLQIEEINSFLKMSSEKFNSKRVQKKLQKTVELIQKSKYQQQSNQRTNLYIIDSMLYATKRKIKLAVSELQNINDMLSLFSSLKFNNICFDDSGAFVMGHLVKNDDELKEVILKLKNSIEDKSKEIDEDIALKALYEIVKLVLREYFPLFKDEIKNLSYTYNFRDENSLLNYNRFILEYKKIEEDFVDCIMYFVFDKFLLLKKEEVSYEI